MSSVA